MQQFINVSQTNIITALVGGFTLVFSLVSHFVKQKLCLSEALVAMAFGIIVGPYCLKLIIPLDGAIFGSHEFTLEFSRLVIATQVAAAGISLKKKYILHQAKSLFIILVPLESLLLSACITPTDPVLANSIVKGRFAEKYVPNNIQEIISAESAANDGIILIIIGLGSLFLYFSIFYMNQPIGEATKNWLGYALAYQTILSLVIGTVIGFSCRKAFYYCEECNLIDKESFLASWLTMTLAAMGISSIVGVNEFVSCFSAGVAFGWNDWVVRKNDESHVQEVIDMLFNFTYFIYFGIIIPWRSFDDLRIDIHIYNLIAIAVLILLFRRLPVILAFYKFIPCVHNWRQAAFVGWFGPIGVGAIYYAIEAADQLDRIKENLYIRKYIINHVYFIVISSVIVHGITIPLYYIGKKIDITNIKSRSFQSIASRLPRYRTDSPKSISESGDNQDVI